jgi:hypothetical protein
MQGKHKKSGAPSSGVDGHAPAVPGDNPQIGLPFTPVAGIESQARSSNQSDAMFPTAFPAPGSATPEEFRVEWNNFRDSGSSAEIAFALRLKPVASAASSGSNTSVRVGGEISPGAPGSLLASPTGNESGSSSQGNNQESTDGNRAAAHKTALPNQLEKAASTEKTETPTFVESVGVGASADQSQLMPPVHSTTSPAVPEAPAPTKAAAQPVPMPAAASLDMEDRLATARPAQEISLQISGAGDRKVDVHLVERAGEVHVIVRTPDVALAHELRQDLGSLTGKLAQSGYGTEQLTSLSAGSSNLSDQRSTPENQDPSRGHGQGPQHGGSGQQQQPQDERGKRPAWVEAMENTLAQRQTNRSTSWLLTR